MNVSDNTIQACYELIKQCFQNNRKLDRLVSVLGVNFAMNNTAELLHAGYAHRFPQISDEIGHKCLEVYNIPVEYGATDEGKQDYNSVAEMVQVVENITVDFQNMLSKAIMIAQDNQDINVYVELISILQDFNPLVEQAILLNDKVKLYGNALYDFDSHIKDNFWII